MGPVLTELDTIIAELSSDKLNVKSENGIEMTDKELIEQEITNLNDKVVETLQRLKNDILNRKFREINKYLAKIGETAINDGDPQPKFLVMLYQSARATREINNIILEIEDV